MVPCWVTALALARPSDGVGLPVSSYSTSNPKRMRKTTWKTSRNPGNISFSSFVSTMAANLSRVHRIWCRMGCVCPILANIYETYRYLLNIAFTVRYFVNTDSLLAIYMRYLAKIDSRSTDAIFSKHRLGMYGCDIWQTSTRDAKMRYLRPGSRS